MADSRQSKSSHGPTKRKEKRHHSQDLGEGSSSGQVLSKRSKRSAPVNPPILAQASKDEKRRHKALERVIQKEVAKLSGAAAQAEVQAQAPVSSPPDHQAPPQISHRDSLSPDRMPRGSSPPPSEAAILFATLSSQEADQAHSLPGPQVVADQASAEPSLAPQPSQEPLPTTIPPALASLISAAIRQGIAEGLQQREASLASEYGSQDCYSVQGEEAARHLDRPASPASTTHVSASAEDLALDQEWSDDEGLEPDQPAFIGLFKPQLFRSLLFKALSSTKMLPTMPDQGAASSGADPSSSLFSEQAVNYRLQSCFLMCSRGNGHPRAQVLFLML